MERAFFWFDKVFKNTANFKRNDCRWTWEDGETLIFRYAKSESDYYGYHGHQYPFMGFDELCSLNDLKLYDQLKSLVRSPFPGVPKIIISATNPYGPGAPSVKQRFVDPAPNNTIIVENDLARVHIWGSITENLAIMQNDPDYYRFLKSMKDEARRAAWLEGSWDAVCGSFFGSVWNADVEVGTLLDFPSHSPVFRAGDWGSRAPFSFGWYLWVAEDCALAFSDNQGKIELKKLKRGDLIRFGEYYGCEPLRPNTGLEKPATVVAKEIKTIEERMQITDRINPHYCVLDKACFCVHNAYTIADDFINNDVYFRPSDSTTNRLTGWEIMKRYLFNAGVPVEDRDEPALFISSGCRNAINILPSLEYDETIVGDLDTDAEDHIADEIRYMCSYVVSSGLDSTITTTPSSY